MSGTSLVNIGELAKPAVVLIEKISDALGGIAKPWQIQRVASAEAKAELIKAQSKIEITELEERALLRMIKQEGLKQKNIEEITIKALPNLSSSAQPENIEDDWIINFFDKGRLISDQDMQNIWANMLTGEANIPGTFSKRTVDLLSNIDKRDAELFTAFCSFVWTIGTPCPVLFDINKVNEFDRRIDFETVNHLDDIGLIKIQTVNGYQKVVPTSTLMVHYFRKPLNLQFNDQTKNLNIGYAVFTKTGSELLKICGAKPNIRYFDAIVDRWINANLLPYEFRIKIPF